jgi:hypothetical protein
MNFSPSHLVEIPSANVGTKRTFNFTGQWHWSSFSESGYFTSDAFGLEKQDENDHNVGVSIDDTQVVVEFKYQNPLDKTIHYTLAIQRSTGRFTESFRTESEKIASSERTGYCVHR